MHAVSLVAAVAIWAILGLFVSTSKSSGAEQVVFWLGCAVVLGLLAGMALHLVRSYDALISRRRSERRTDTDQTAGIKGVHAWPRGSSDADFIVQLGVSICVLVLGALS